MRASSWPPLVALAVLTRLPLPAMEAASPADRARATPWFPLAGLAVGGLVSLTAAILSGLPPFLGAAVAVAVWIGVTGAATLQGLADTVDGYAGGRGDRRRILDIMEDRRGGVGAVAAAVLVVLAKVLATGCLARHGLWAGLVAAPLAGRTLLPAVLAVTPPSSGETTHKEIVRRLDRAATMLGVLAGAAAVAFLMGSPGLGAVAVLAVAAAGLRSLFKRTLGGFTRHTLGATCELGELVALGLAVWGAGAC